MGDGPVAGKNIVSVAPIAHRAVQRKPEMCFAVNLFRLRLSAHLVELVFSGS